MIECVCVCVCVCVHLYVCVWDVGVHEVCVVGLHIYHIYFKIRLSSAPLSPPLFPSVVYLVFYA